MAIVVLEHEADAYGRDNLKTTSASGIYQSTAIGCVHKQDGLCKIYQDRPMDCRIHPMMVTKEELHFDIFCPFTNEMVMRALNGDEEMLTYMREIVAKAEAYPEYIKFYTEHVIKGMYAKMHMPREILDE
jgi:Fe-S-cluster containining protein